ncbi:hypothetical protein [Absidia glauca]|uniref:MULE transposase domain-containing protein n=1 Tax=Absidia glauca TaxID=4829 RepID=A0A168PVD8_ABSGL|nr:hypothetical protein [Absidia glauca]
MISQRLIGRQYSDTESMSADIRKFANKNGFAVQQSISYKQNSRYFYCNQRTEYKDKVDPETRTRQGNYTRTTKCTWKVYVRKCKQDWCVGKVILHDGSVIVNPHDENAVPSRNQEHSHDLITDPSVLASVFPQARSLDAKQTKTIASMLKSGCHASNIVDTMLEDQGKIIKPVDVYNINQRVVKASFLGKSKDDQLMHQIDEMRKDGFVIKTNVSDDSVLRMPMITHPDAINLTKRFSDVLVVDATYQTNNLDMSLFNLVGFSNLGGKSLKTFVAASVLMVNETAINYKWALTTFKETIWAGKDEEVSTKIMISDQDHALCKEIEAVFHQSRHILCTWHVMNNFVKLFKRSFKVENGKRDGDKEHSCHKLVNKLFYASDEQAFNETGMELEALFSFSQNHEKLQKHLNRRNGVDLGVALLGITELGRPNGPKAHTPL